MLTNKRTTILNLSVKMSTKANQEIIVKTQKTLGKYVKKPTLTDKLLQKPPFRFLHDVIKAVIKDTGFLNGLFTEDELNSDNVKEKEAKLAFLSKLIDAVKTVSKTDLKVRPSKIVAGLEPIETNILLQTIAKCVDRKIDTTQYVNKAKRQINKASNEKESRIKQSRKTDTKKRDNSISKSKKSPNETPKLTNREKIDQKQEKTEQKQEKSEQKQEKPEEKTKEEKQILNDVKIPTSIVSDLSTVPTENTIEEPVPKQTNELANRKEEIDISTFSNARQSSAGLVRPKSARPKSGDRTQSTKTATTLRPPSVRPSSARPGAPRLRPETPLHVKEPVAMGNIKVIVENFDSGLGDDEEDTVVIQNAVEINEENGKLLDISGENKGQLVEQILEQIEEHDDVPYGKNKVEIEWDNLKGRDATTKEVTNLRAAIQSLTKTANPLGKLMNYLHEDLDAMHNELQMWTNTKRQIYVEIDKQKRLASEVNKPLMEKLTHLRQEIRKREEEILIIRGNILRKETRISELLAGNK